MESSKRSILKAITWRIIAALITSVLVLIVSGEQSTAVVVGVIDTTIKLVVFFCHERIWNGIGYGRD